MGLTLSTPLPKVPERLIIIRRPKPETKDLGSYAVRVVEGTAGDGDIWPDMSGEEQ